MGSDRISSSVGSPREQLIGSSRGASSLTLADFSLGAAMNLAEMARYPVEPYSEIKRWFRTLSALPAWQKTLAQAALRGSFPVHLRGYAVKM